MNFWGVMAAVFGGGAVGAAVVKLIDNIVMYKLGRKAKAEDGEVANLEQMTKDIRLLKEHDEKDNGRFECIERQLARSDKTSQALMKAINALLSHAMTGNASGQMKKAQENLVNFIIEN